MTGSTGLTRGLTPSPGEQADLEQYYQTQVSELTSITVIKPHSLMIIPSQTISLQECTMAMKNQETLIYMNQTTVMTPYITLMTTVKHLGGKLEKLGHGGEKL